MQRLLRRAHLLLGCFFAPALLYFAVSGAWQVFGWHRLLKSGAQQEVRATFQEASNPHMVQAMPYSFAKTSQSPAFKWFAAGAAGGFAVTAAIGVYLAFRVFRPRWLVALALVAGIAVPSLMLWAAVRDWQGELVQHAPRPSGTP